MEGRRGKKGSESLAHPRGHPNLPPPKAAVQGQGPGEVGAISEQVSSPVTRLARKGAAWTIGIRTFEKAAQHHENQRATGGVTEVPLKGDEGMARRGIHPAPRPQPPLHPRLAQQVSCPCPLPLPTSRGHHLPSCRHVSSALPIQLRSTGRQ